ncbi:unnamed protein product, partial [Closterium sp. NIES-65]
MLNELSSLLSASLLPCLPISHLLLMPSPSFSHPSFLCVFSSLITPLAPSCRCVR